MQHGTRTDKRRKPDRELRLLPRLRRTCITSADSYSQHMPHLHVFPGVLSAGTWEKGELICLHGTSNYVCNRPV
jgi:hypothetical protein